MCTFIIVLLVLAVIIFVILVNKKSEKEGFRDPIYLNPKKLIDDYYPKSNWTIYGKESHILSGYPYYPKAY